MTSRNAMSLVERNRLIRHRLEEASTHIGMVKKLLSSSSRPVEEPVLSRIGKTLNQLHHRHGGIEH